MTAKDKLIEVAVAPLEGKDAELSVQVRSYLETELQLDETRKTGPIISRLRRRSGHGWTRWAIVLIWLMSLVGALWVLGKSVRPLRELGAISNIGTAIGPALEPRPEGREDLTPSESLLLFGGPEQLWRSEPDNPAYFVEFAASKFQRSRALPDDFLETAGKIDPDNGWYELLAAAALSRDAVEKKRAGMRRAGTTYEIKDRAAHRQALALVHEAAGKPRIEDHALELLQTRVSLLPEVVDYADYIRNLAFTAGQDVPSAGLIHIFRLGLAAEAERVGVENDLEGYRRLQADVANLVNRLVQKDGGLIDMLIVRAAIKSLADEMGKSATALGLPEEALRYGELMDRLDAKVIRSPERAAQLGELEELVTSKGGIMASLSMPMVARQSREVVGFSEADLRPVRRAEYAVVGQAMAGAGWLMLIMAVAGVAVFVAYGSRLSRWIAARMIRGLGIADWGWIVAIGSLLPLGWYLAIGQASPLAAHHWSFGRTHFVQFAGQMTGVCLMILVAPVVVARWRVTRSLGFLIRSGKLRWFGWMMVGLAALLIPASSLALTPTRPRLLLIIVLAGLPQLWLLWVVIAGLFGRAGRSVSRRLVARATLPAYTLSGVLLVAAMFAFRQQERSWMARAQFAAPSTDAPGLEPYEFRVARQLRRELQEVAGRLPGGEFVHSAPDAASER
ncbi:hypothetical protein [Haloferula sargassicola]|uniref:Uncharacterized protein n=1 Tax=Haloferula sargassicola TaxID=490096 RepID=A0ABP9UMC7_9BACT